MDLKEIGEGMDYFDLAQNKDRWLSIVKSEMNLPVP
jgi:hypothetical protein